MSNPKRRYIDELSGTIKLSELLGAGVAAFESDADYFRESGHCDLAQRCLDKAIALRAIAPALVEAVNGVFEHRRKVAEEPEYLHRTDVCEACKLALTLEAAGVTCE